MCIVVYGHILNCCKFINILYNECDLSRIVFRAWQLTRETVDEKSEKLCKMNLDFFYTGNILLQTVRAVSFQIEPCPVNILREGLVKI